MAKIELNWVKHYRKKQGLSLDQISMLSGLSKSTISDLENHKKIPSQITIIRVSRALGMPAHRVFNLRHDLLDRM